MKTFARENLKTLRNDINEALEAVGIKHDIQLKAGNCSYDDHKATFKLVGEAGEAEVNAAAEFQKNKWMINNSEDHPRFNYGETFTEGGTSYRLTAIVPRRHKYPISAVNISNGKSYKFPTKLVALALRASAK